MSSPLVTVVIPVFNGERYLAEAIRSVLDQAYRPQEIVVVDDGSTDRTADVARRFGPEISYVPQPRSGAGAARNRGVELARGEYLAFLDADDLWLPGKLAIQTVALARENGPDIVFGHVEHFHSPELDESQRRRFPCPLGAEPGYLCGAMLTTRETFLRVGFFESKWRAGELIDWYLRALDRGVRAEVLSEVVLRRRIHGSNHTLRHRETVGDYLSIVRASLQRRRAASTGRHVREGDSA
jgi:glycosyltransferase involved in cell wall biosynthesis